MAYKVAIIDEDLEYSKELKKQIDRCYKDIRLMIFENVNEYKIKNKELQEKIDLLLINNKNKIELEKNEKAIFMNEEFGEKEKFFKYRKVNELVDDIKLNLIEEIDAKNKLVQSKIITVYSPYCEDTSFKYANKIANMLSNSKKTFFLTLGMFSGIDENEEKSGMNVIDAIFNSEYLNSDIFLKNVKIRNENLNLFYQLENSYELLNITPKDIEKLINKILDMKYEYVVINVDPKIDAITLKIFDKSTMIFVVSEKERTKIKRFYNFFAADDKLKDIKEKFIEIKSANNEKINLEDVKRILTNI